MRIGFTKNGAVKTVTTSKIGYEQRPKYLERNSLLLEQRMRKAGALRLQRKGAMTRAIAVVFYSRLAGRFGAVMDAPSFLTLTPIA